MLVVTIIIGSIIGVIFIQIIGTFFSIKNKGKVVPLRN